MISIGSNASSLQMSNLLTNITDQIEHKAKVISSGKRILTAADDPAGVKEEQLTTLTQGSLSPYSKNKESKSKNHSDRRVNAYIVLKNSKEEKLNKIKPLTEWTNKLNKEGE